MRISPPFLAHSHLGNLRVKLVAWVGIEPTDVYLMRVTSRLCSILAIYTVARLLPRRKDNLRFLHVVRVNTNNSMILRILCYACHEENSHGIQEDRQSSPRLKALHEDQGEFWQGPASAQAEGTGQGEEEQGHRQEGAAEVVSATHLFRPEAKES